MMQPVHKGGADDWSRSIQPMNPSEWPVVTASPDDLLHGLNEEQREAATAISGSGVEGRQRGHRLDEGLAHA